MEKIPDGIDKASIKRREEIIREAYGSFFRKNPGKKVYNRDLDDYLHVRFLSVEETTRHAAKTYRSTLAVLQLEAILATARRHGKPLRPKPGVKNQARFSEMLEMRCALPGIGTAKLMVGVLRGSRQKLQYCITALDAK